MSHPSVVSLLVVFRLILIRPHIVVVFIEFIKLLNDLTGTNLDDLLLFVIVIPSSTLFLSLAFRLFLFALALGFFSTVAFTFSVLTFFFLFFDAVIEAFYIIGRFAASLSFLCLDPVPAFLQHLFPDLILFHVVDLILYVILGIHVVIHVRLLNLFALIHSFLCTIDRLVPWFTAHAQENHFFLTEIIDSLASQYSF